MSEPEEEHLSFKLTEEERLFILECRLQRRLTWRGVATAFASRFRERGVIEGNQLEGEALCRAAGIDDVLDELAFMQFD